MKNKLTKIRTGKAFEDQVELIAMGVKRCACAIDRRAYGHLRKQREDEIRQISATVNLAEQGEGFFDGTIGYELVVRDKNNKNEPVRLECVFEAHFHGPKAMRRADAERFLETYFRVISWPYFRQFVSDMTARMAIPPLVLPLLPESGKK